MIDDLSKTLQVLLSVQQTSPDPEVKKFFDRLRAEAPALAERFREMAADFAALAKAVIKFDRPVEEYQADAQGTINLFLYDIRENMELRSNEPLITRDNGMATLQRPPRRLACSYLVTAWFGKEKELQEQGLLSQALQVLSVFPTIPNELLWGSLKDQQPQLPMVTLAADGMKNPAEFWTALGGKLRPSFTVTVTISVPVAKPEKPVKLVTERDVRVGEKAPGKQKLLSAPGQAVKDGGT